MDKKQAKERGHSKLSLRSVAMEHALRLPDSRGDGAARKADDVVRDAETILKFLQGK